MLQRIRKQSTLLLFLLAGLIGLFYLLNLRDGHDWGDDFSLYILHAQNLVTGVGYANTGYIYNPEQPDYSPQAYPPIYPLILAPLAAVFGLQLAVLKLAGLACFIAFLFLFARLAATLNLPHPVKMLLICAVGLHPLFWSMTDHILSDLPFLLFNTLALVRIQALVCTDASRARRVEYSRRKEYTRAALAGLLIYLAYGTRAIGIVLLPVLLAFDMLKNRRIRPSTIGAAALAVVLIAVQAILIPETGSYFGTFQGPLVEQIQRAADFTRLYYDSFSHLFPFRDGLTRHLLFDFALLMALIGYSRRLKTGLSIFEVFVPIYLGIVLAWPAYQGMRFLIPTLPFFLIYTYEGCVFLLQAMACKKNFQIAILTGFLFTLAFSYRDGLKIPAFQRVDNIGSVETQQMFSYIREQTPQSAAIVFYKPRAMRLFTGHPALLATIPAVKAPVLEQIQAAKADYFVVEWDNSLGNQPAWQAFATENPAVFTLVFENTHFRIYRIQ